MYHLNTSFSRGGSKQWYLKEKSGFVGVLCMSKNILENEIKQVKTIHPLLPPTEISVAWIGQPEYAHFSQQHMLVGAREGLGSHSSRPNAEVPRCLRSYDPMVVLPWRMMRDRVHNFLGWSSGQMAIKWRILLLPRTTQLTGQCGWLLYSPTEQHLMTEKLHKLADWLFLERFWVGKK